MKSSKRKKESKDEQTRGKRKSKKVDRFVFLPDDILLDILKRVPDAFLRYKAKYVCRRWFNIITNRILLDHASFILQKVRNFQMCLVDIMEGGEGLQVKEQCLDIPRIGAIKSWCNEVLLISDYEREESLHVYNLITKEGSYIPECNASCGEHEVCICTLSLSFDRFKGIHKVVHLFMGPPIQCEIYVLRRDIVTRASSKWKKIEVPYINVGQYCLGDPVLVEGRYLHWDVIASDYLISMDVVKEKIVQMKLPGSGDYTRFDPSSFVIGGNLTRIEKVSREKAQIWILKDFERKKWDKLQLVTVQIFLEIRRFPGVLCPVSGVISKSGVIIILESRLAGRLFSYDLKDGVLKELDHSESYDHSFVHSSAPSFI